MIAKNLVEIFIPVITVDSEGHPIKTWRYGGFYGPDFTLNDGNVWNDNDLLFEEADETIYADVQPVTLSPYMNELWGISDNNSNTKKMFTEPDSVIIDTCRVRVDGMELYTVKGKNKWIDHDVHYLVPVVGE